MPDSNGPSAICLSVLIVSALVLSVTARAQERPPAAIEMAKTYGINSFGQIEKLRYTWNLEVPGMNISHTWEWEPKTGQVSYQSKDKEGKPVNVTYQRSRLDAQSETVKNEIDPAFINDQYWLLLPLHVAWDGAEVIDEGMNNLPLGQGSAERLVVKYPSEGGYAPGDTWELYLGADHQVKEIMYRGGGPGTQKRPKLLSATWADHKKAGPLLIATDHRGTADGVPLQVSLSDVSVKLMGLDTWMNAQ